MNKKGLGDAGLMIIRVILVAVVIAVVAFAMGSTVTEVSDTKQLENQILLTRILYSPTGIAYTEPSTGRTYPGIIDKSKLNDKLAETLALKEKAVKITLTNVEGNALSEPYYTDRAKYDEFAALTFSKRFDEETNRYYLIARNPSEDTPQIVDISIVYATDS